MAWQTKRLPAAFDLLAPDGSQIRELMHVERGSMVHCTLRRGEVTQATRHRTVEELWYCVAGAGEVWRSDGVHEEVVQLRPGVSLTIPCGVSFQFRAHDKALELLITTMPPWPGAAEAEPVQGVWPATAAGGDGS